MSLLDNLVSYWVLNETSGNALDSHSTNHLTETSGTIGAAAGKITGARDFEAGDTEYFARTDNADLSTGDIDFTFACWVMPESLSSVMAIAHKGWNNLAQTDTEWALYYNSSVSRPAFRVVGGTTFSNETRAASNLTVGVWSHLLVQHDSVNKQIGISLNNATLVTSSHSAGVNNGNREFQIGATSLSSWYWDGLICEAGFWKRLLTSDERTQLYNNGNGLAYPWATIAPKMYSYRKRRVAA